MNEQIIHTKKSKLFLDVKLKDIRFIRVLRSIFEAGLRMKLILALIITGLTVVTSNTDYLFGLKSFTVLSGSMEPAIPTGSIIYTMKNLGYNLNDVITYKTETGQTVTHRIVGIDSNGQALYRTQGDANNAADSGYVTNEMIIGKTYFSLPYIGKMSVLLKDPKNLFLVVFFPALIVIGYELWVIKKEIEKSVERRVRKQLENQRGGQTHSLWPDSIS